MKFWQLTVFGLLAFAMVARAEDDAAAAADPSAEPEAEPEAEPASAEPEPEVEPTAEGHQHDHDDMDHDHDDMDHDHDTMDHDHDHDHDHMDHDHMGSRTDAGEEPATKGEASPNTKDPDNGCGAFQLSAALMVPALMALMAH